MSEEVKLLGVWGSPFSRRVELALRLKGIAFDYKEEENVYGNKSSLLLESNPIYKKIPVLIHGGKPILESLIIIEYIDDNWSGYPLLPKDPFERAKARLLAKFIDDKCITTLWTTFWSERDAEKKLIDQSNEYLSILERELEGKKFFGGESIGIVDIASNFFTVWLDALQKVSGINLINEEKYPSICKWTREFIKCDAVEESIPDRQKLRDFFQAIKDSSYSYSAANNSSFFSQT